MSSAMAHLAAARLPLALAVAPARASSGGGPSHAAIAVAVVAAVVILVILAWSIARMSAYEPRWTLSVRHSLEEARFRASATWAEFSDWARLGH
jgi:type IV secretory pathway TrbD component